MPARRAETFLLPNLIACGVFHGVSLPEERKPASLVLLSQVSTERMFQSRVEGRFLAVENRCVDQKAVQNHCLVRKVYIQPLLRDD